VLEQRGVDPSAYRRAMSRLPTGVTLLTTAAAEQAEVMTANAVMSVSLDPLLLVVSVKAPSRWLSAVTDHGAFAVNVLAEHHAPLSRWAASSARHQTHDPLNGWETRASAESGCALLVDAAATFDCVLDAVHGAGDHALVVGRVLAVGASELSRPLLFHGSQYVGLGEPVVEPAACSSAAG
jgi:flavin reductase (DIM6/NTAB) family NADH-FMN oxidoreductase RutF